jgi:hypothetical protein
LNQSVRGGGHELAREGVVVRFAHPPLDLRRWARRGAASYVPAPKQENERDALYAIYKTG